MIIETITYTSRTDALEAFARGAAVFGGFAPEALLQLLVKPVQFGAETVSIADIRTVDELAEQANASAHQRHYDAEVAAQDLDGPDQTWGPSPAELIVYTEWLASSAWTTMPPDPTRPRRQVMIWGTGRSYIELVDNEATDSPSQPELRLGIREYRCASAMDWGQAMTSVLTRRFAATGTSVTVGANLIAVERIRQLATYTPEHEREHDDGELPIRAAELALASTGARVDLCDLLFDADAWELCQKHRGDRIKQLTIAGALIAAEIDRLGR